MELTWWQIVSALRAALAAADTGGASVQVGDGGTVPEARTVLVVRGPTTPSARHGTVPGEQVVRVQCWEHDTDPEAAYARLATLESQVYDALHAWANAQPFPGAETRAAIGTFQGDGDLFRPSVGSQLEITLKWRPRPA